MAYCMESSQPSLGTLPLLEAWPLQGDRACSQARTQRLGGPLLALEGVFFCHPPMPVPSMETCRDPLPNSAECGILTPSRSATLGPDQMLFQSP